MTSSKRMEDLIKPLQVITQFHFVNAPILTMVSLLSMSWIGELDYNDLGKKEFSILGYILGNIFFAFGWLWTYWISKSINTQQPIKRIYLKIMLFLYILVLLGPIYMMLDFKFSLINNTRSFHLIVFFVIFCTAIFGISIIYNILQYYKMSSPEQNVNNFFRNKKIGKTIITSKLKVKQPKKSIF